MRSNRFLIKTLAIFLFVVFSQKIGVGLYLHNVLHNSENKQLPGQSENKGVNYSCNCIDDFSMPFAEATIETLPPGFISHCEFTSFYKESIPVFFRHFNSLRGPPASFI